MSDDYDDLINLFKREPMWAREFADAHEKLNTPWFRIRCLYFYCLQRIRRWIGLE
jgi:hypothetical protein